MGQEIPQYMQELNPEQRQAVLHSLKPLLILAGAGSGKTRVITTKIAHLIKEEGVSPRSILAVTFTNKAAKEMAQRACDIEPLAAGCMLRTFHSFGSWFLRRNGGLAGIDSSFIIYDDEDMVTLLGAIAPEIKKTDLKLIAHNIARAKDYFLPPDSPGIDKINHTKMFKNIYKKYEEALARCGNVDFGDLIKKPVEILRANPNVAERLRDRFRVIMVDEYQDANIAQFELLKEISGDNTYICVVGDDDQSIYRFRGAEVRNILEFPKIFGDADIIRLVRNYRSTSQILQVASSVIKHNSGRLGKELVAERGEGYKPQLTFLPDQDQEARSCADLINRSINSINNGINKPEAKYSDWAILYRTNAQSLAFENEFLRRKIPYRIVGSLKFYEREEIKDAIALLSFLVNPKDEVSFRRVINKPARGIGATTVQRILDARYMEEDWNIESACKKMLPSLSAKAAAGMKDFLCAIQESREIIEEPDISIIKGSITKKNTSEYSKKDSSLKAVEGLSSCIAHLIHKAGIDEYHRAHDDINGEQRVANLQELLNGSVLYPLTNAGLIEFLEHIELDRAIEMNEDATDRVTLITVHNTKGAEFKRVIMTGLEQGLFPRNEKNGEDLEEERRLFYVGVTRAMDELYLTCCRERRVFGQRMNQTPSLFLREADKTQIRITGNVPFGFLSARSTDAGSWAHGNAVVTAAPKKNISSDGRWQQGDTVFHDDNGYGEVIKITESDDGPVIKVKFQTGREVQFLSMVQSSSFMKIKN
ncbi:DNA helicase [Spirochaetia bacterium]|nr:DNA helicase [Spirochaetia bacterium]